MDIHDQSSAAARGDALIRLRTVTAGVAVVAVAATAGLGFAAASGYRGTTPATDPSLPSATQAPADQPASGTGGSSSGGQPQQLAPQDGGFSAPAPGTLLQPPSRTNGGRGGHATTGGS